MSKLTIVRGLPGSGKSTLAKKMNIDHYEADMFYVVNGEYIFDSTLITFAHKWCLSSVIMSMRHDVDVVVSNTFTRLFMLDEYIAAANMFGYDIEIIEMTENYGSIHNLPEDKFELMKAGWQELTEEYRAYL